MAFAGGSNALTVVLVRNSVGTLAIAVFMLASGAPLALKPRDRLVALALGVVLALNNLLLNMAVERVPVPVVVLSFYTYPVWMALWGWLRGSETFSAKSAAGVLLAFAGLALTLTLGVGPELPDPLGVGMAIAGAILWVVVLLLSDGYLRHAPSHARTLHMFGSASLVVLVLTLALGHFTLPSTASGIAALAWVPLAYSAGIVGLLWANSSMGPMRASFYMNFEPIASLVLSALVLGQTLGPLQLVGAGFVIVSLLIFRPPPAEAPLKD